jgi:hypothetical protein
MKTTSAAGNALLTMPPTRAGRIAEPGHPPSKTPTMSSLTAVSQIRTQPWKFRIAPHNTMTVLVNVVVRTSLA